MNYEDIGFSRFLTKTIFEKRKSALDLQGNFQGSAIYDNQLIGVSMSKLQAGTISVVGNLGGENVIIDGPNQRIIINDDADNRILIGYQSGGF